MKVNGLMFPLLILVLYAAPISAGTQSPSTQPIKLDYRGAWVWEYRGAIGDSLPIGMTLRFAMDGKSARGCYFYYKYCKDIRIDAAIDGRSILIREYDARGNQTGQFAGHLPATDPRHHFSESTDLEGEVIAGHWSKPNGSEQRPFYLREEFMDYWPEGTCRYAAAGFNDQGSVDRFMARFRQAILDRDAHAVASMIAFPIDISLDGGILPVADSEDFLAQYGKIFVPKFVDQIRLATPCHLFSKDDGVMLGNGEVWVSPESSAGKLAPAVTSINDNFVVKAFTDDKAISFMKKAPTFIAFEKSAKGDWSYMIDSSADNEIEMSVGHNHPQHFEIDERFKILSNGTVYVWSASRDVDDGWKLDYQPKD